MTEAMYYVLLALRTPSHGYGIIKRIAALSGGRVRMGAGTLYGLLTRLQADGWIVLTAQDERRKVYALTDSGKTALRGEYARLKQLVLDGAELEGLE